MRLSLPLLAAVAAMALPGAASAQVVDWTRGWSGQATIYGWLPTINGSQEGPDGRPIVDLDTSDVLSALDMAFMGNLQFQRDKVGVFFDAVYADLGTDGTWVQNRIDTSTNTKLGMYTAAVSYRVYDDPRGFFDLYAGARYFDTSVEFKLPNNTFSKSLNWTDGIVGVRGGVSLTERWELTGFADAGGFDGSKDMSWQLYGGANYEFTDRWQGTIGYRYVSIQKEVTDRASLDIDLQGPLLGVTWKF
jgi:opacity protein-like surface antigen